MCGAVDCLRARALPGYIPCPPPPPPKQADPPTVTSHRVAHVPPIRRMPVVKRRTALGGGNVALTTSGGPPGPQRCRCRPATAEPSDKKDPLLLRDTAVPLVLPFRARLGGLPCPWAQAWLRLKTRRGSTRSTTTIALSSRGRLVGPADKRRGRQQPPRAPVTGSLGSKRLLRVASSGIPSPCALTWRVRRGRRGGKAGVMKAE